MAVMTSVPCPRCQGPIRCETASIPDQFGVTAPAIEEGTERTFTVYIHLNELDVRRHIPCFSGPYDGGEPIPLSAVA